MKYIFVLLFFISLSASAQEKKAQWMMQLEVGKARNFFWDAEKRGEYVNKLITKKINNADLLNFKINRIGKRNWEWTTSLSYTKFNYIEIIDEINLKNLILKRRFENNISSQFNSTNTYDFIAKSFSLNMGIGKKIKMNSFLSITPKIEIMMYSLFLNDNDDQYSYITNTVHSYEFDSNFQVINTIKINSGYSETNNRNLKIDKEIDINDLFILGEISAEFRYQLSTRWHLSISPFCRLGYNRLYEVESKYKNIDNDIILYRKFAIDGNMWGLKSGLAYTLGKRNKDK